MFVTYPQTVQKIIMCIFTDRMNENSNAVKFYNLRESWVKGIQELIVCKDTHNCIPFLIYVTYWASI